MRRKIAIGTLGLMVLLGAAIVVWAEEGAPQGGGPGQGQHQFGGGEHHEWGGGRGQFGRPGEGRMGWQRGGRHEFGGGEHLLRMAENPRVRQYLGLSDEQVGKLHSLGVEAEKASIQTRSQMELGHIELRELLRADNPDRDAIMKKLDEVNDLRGRMQKQQVQTLLDARSVLTPDQLKKVKAFMENRGMGGGMERQHMMEHHGGPGRPPGQHEGAEGHGGPSPHPPAPPTQ